MARFIRFSLVFVLGVGALLVLIALMPSALWAGSGAGPTALSSPHTASGPALGAMQVAFPPGTRLTPMGAGQTDATQRREAYRALFQAIYEREDLAWMATPLQGTLSFPAGSVLGDLSGPFTTYNLAGGATISRAFALHPIRIALFDSGLRDEFDQTVVWERGDFEQLFRVYLWSNRFTVVTETAILNGALTNYDLLIIPAFRLGWAEEVAASLGDDGLEALRRFVEQGGWLYAQSDGAWLAQAAGLVPTGTVDLTSRVTDLDNRAALALDLPDHPLTFSWLELTTYVLNEPRLSATAGVSVVAHYDGDTTAPGAPALLTATYGKGRVILMNGHPSDQVEDYPQVIDVLLWAMGRRAGFHGTLCQTYTDAVGCRVIPAYEAGVPIRITSTFKNLWDGPLSDVIVTETLQPGFTTTWASIQPAPTALYTNPDGSTTIVWASNPPSGTASLPNQVPPGETVFAYTAWTEDDTLAAGSARVSRAEASYYDPYEGRRYTLRRNDLWISAKMAARLVGDRDIELDAIYPLPAGGAYFDIALPLENKEETNAHHVVITDLVALVSPIVDADDQRRIPQVVSDTVSGGAALSSTLWAVNSVFFYSTPVSLYPLPTISGVAASVGVTYGLAYANAVYTFTGSFTTTPGYSNSITIPPSLSGVVTLTDEGLVLPALRMVWDLGTFPAYDYQEPAIRYGLFSRESEGRTVSVVGDPISPSLVLEASGASIFTNLGGHPIPYHEYLRSGIVHVPVPEEMPRVTYADLWERPQTTTLRTTFYDLVPFPGPERHAVVNTTFEMRADRDGDGVGETRVLEFPAREGADLILYLKSWSNVSPSDPPLQKDETLIRQGMFRGLGFSLEPWTGSWWDSWWTPNLQGVVTATDLVTVVRLPAYDFLYFQQYLESQQREAIVISATLGTYPGFHREGVMKVDDGARFVYHQKAAGPSRYEVFDTQVQAVFGLSADPQLQKWVAPVLIATYEDQVYHFIRIQDPWDPREFGWEPFIKSYGFGELAATVYVGGRHGSELLFPRLRPGGRTQVRLEIRNNQTGITLTNLVITPVAPAGITVTPRSVTETQAVEPIFYDFPFLHQTTVPEGWRTVWYFDVEVSPTFTDTGRTQEIRFQVTADGLPADFQVPAALIGVEDNAGRVRTVYGQATDLLLEDLLPPDVSPLEARIGNTDEITALQAALALGQPTTATALFQGLRSAGLTTRTVAGGTQVTFTLPVSGDDDATQMPWLDGGERDGTLWVVLKSKTTIPRSGTNLVNDGPTLTFTDDFSQTYTAEGNEETVEVHGAAMVVTYTVNGITLTKNGKPLKGFLPGKEHLLDLTLLATNQGDYIASSVRLTAVLTSGGVLSSTSVPTVAQGTNYAAWALGDVAPGETKAIRVTLVVTPPVTGTVTLGVTALPESWVVIERTDGHFVNEFTHSLMPHKVVVDRTLAGALRIGSATRFARLFLPIVTRNYQNTWWPKGQDR